MLAVAGLEVVGEAVAVTDAVTATVELSPDIVLIDQSLPGMGGDVVRRLRTCRALVVVLAGPVERARLFDALDAGAQGYLLKTQDRDELVAGLRVVANGDIAIAPKAMTVLIDDRASHRAAVVTSRERETVRLVAQGLTNKQIARHLGITEATVKSHLGSSFQKIGVTGRTQAALWVRGHER